MKVIEDFVPFQMAIKLKEKGLILSKEYIFGAYDEDGDLFSMLEYNIEEYWCAYAPTIAQSLKWLREDKGVNIILTLWSNGWYVDIQSFDKEEDEEGVAYEVGYIFQSPDYETYEQAALAGIEYVINNLI